MKHLKWWLVVFLLVVVLWQWNRQAQASETEPLSTEAQQFLSSLPAQWLNNEDLSNDGQLWVAGEILVGHFADQSLAPSSRLLSRMGYRIAKQQSLRTADRATGKAIVVERWQVPDGAEWALIASLQNQPDVLFAEPNWLCARPVPATVRAPMQLPHPSPHPFPQPSLPQRPVPRLQLPPQVHPLAHPQAHRQPCLQIQVLRRLLPRSTPSPMCRMIRFISTRNGICNASMPHVRWRYWIRATGRSCPPAMLWSP